jgi:hypothetical protein
VTFGEILSATYEDLNLNSSPAAAVVTRLKRYVNEGVRAILREPGLQRLADADAAYTFASVASTTRYVLPEAVARIHSISERTNDHALEVMPLSVYRRIEPDPANTGTPSHYVPIGRVAVAAPPSDASNLFVDSTAAGDTTQTAYIEGLVTGGYRRTASVTLTGTTAVSISSTISTWEVIEDFYLSAAAAGTVTLHEDASGGTELARITIGQTRPRYYGFHLWPTPGAAVTYYVDYRREVTDLVNSTDEPPLPTDFHPLLVMYARMREYEKTDDSRYEQARADFGLGLVRLKFSTQWVADELPVMGGTRLGRSRLGGMYPADSFFRG